MLGERILRYALGFLIGIWIARYVGPEQYGLLNYALAFVTVLAFLSTLGLDGLVVRELVRNPGARDEMLGTLVTMRLLGGLILIGTVAAGLLVVQPDDHRAPALIALISLAVVMQAVESIDCWFQSILASRFTAVAKAAALLIATFFRIALILSHAPLVAFAWAILAESILLAVGLLSAYRRSGGQLAAMRPRRVRAGALVKDGWPLILSAFVAAVYLRIDQVLLGQLAGFAEVGAYAVAARVVEVSYIIPAVLATAVFPAMVKSKEGNKEAYDVQIQGLFNVVIWAAILVAIPTSLLAPYIVDVLVSGAYADAGPVLAILAWMPILVFFGMVRQRWLIAENALRTAMLVEVVGCVLNVVCNLLLIPPYGAIGAAWAALLASAGSTLLLLPFLSNIRQSVRMFLTATIAPLRMLRSRPSHL